MKNGSPSFLLQVITCEIRKVEELETCSQIKREKLKDGSGTGTENRAEAPPQKRTIIYVPVNDFPIITGM